MYNGIGFSVSILDSISNPRNKDVSLFYNNIIFYIQRTGEMRRILVVSFERLHVLISVQIFLSRFRTQMILFLDFGKDRLRRNTQGF